MSVKPVAWRWMANCQYLVEDVGSRNVVLTVYEDEFATRSDAGLLIPLTRDHPVAKILEAAPELAEALQHIADASRSLNHRDTCDCSLCTEVLQADELLARITPK